MEILFRPYWARYTIRAHIIRSTLSLSRKSQRQEITVINPIKKKGYTNPLNENLIAHRVAKATVPAVVSRWITL